MVTEVKVITCDFCNKTLAEEEALIVNETDKLRICVVHTDSYVCEDEPCSKDMTVLKEFRPVRPIHFCNEICLSI